MPGMNPDELKTRRETLGMTQAQLAEALGVDVMTVSRWERGARPLSPLLPLALKGLESEIKKPNRKGPAAAGKRVSAQGPGEKL